MGLFFDSYKPIISKEELRQARQTLRAHGFTDHDINMIDEIFRGDVESENDSQRGIDKKELENALKWMRENKSKHQLSDQKINMVQEVFSKFL